MSEAAIWVVIAGLTAVTVFTRSIFLVLGDRFPLPERLQHALRFAPACALVALIAPEILLQSDGIDVSLGNDRLVAGLCAALAMLLTRRVLLVMLIGMAVFTALRLA
jgi:branched-subunit amino acid transport protein